MKIARNLLFSLKQSLNEAPISTILGPRQCGKTTLVKMLEAEMPEILHLDMENANRVSYIKYSIYLMIHGTSLNGFYLIHR